MNTAKAKPISTAVLILLIIGCAPTPFQRLDPAGSTWTVTDATGVDLPETSVVVAFDETGRYEIMGPCRVVTGNTWIDTDGKGFGFFDPKVRTKACNDPRTDEAVIGSLLAVESWDVTDTDHIVLFGPAPIKLARVP